MSKLFIDLQEKFQKVLKINLPGAFNLYTKQYIQKLEKAEAAKDILYIVSFTHRPPINFHKPDEETGLSGKVWYRSLLPKTELESILELESDITENLAKERVKDIIIFKYEMALEYIIKNPDEFYKKFKVYKDPRALYIGSIIDHLFETLCLLKENPDFTFDGLNLDDFKEIIEKAHIRNDIKNVLTTHIKEVSFDKILRLSKQCIEFSIYDEDFIELAKKVFKINKQEYKGNMQLLEAL